MKLHWYSGHAPLNQNLQDIEQKLSWDKKPTNIYQMMFKNITNYVFLFFARVTLKRKTHPPYSPFHASSGSPQISQVRSPELFPTMAEVTVEKEAIHLRSPRERMMIFLGGGFKHFFFTPTWGDDPIWLIFFKWVETTNQMNFEKKNGGGRRGWVGKIQMGHPK